VSVVSVIFDPLNGYVHSTNETAFPAIGNAFWFVSDQSLAGLSF